MELFTSCGPVTNQDNLHIIRLTLTSFQALEMTISVDISSISQLALSRLVNTSEIFQHPWEKQWRRVKRVRLQSSTDPQTLSNSYMVTV